MQITKLDLLVRSSHRRQFQIAGVCGIHHTTFSQYVRGIKALKPHHIIALAKYFQVTPEDIVGWVNVGEIDINNIGDNNHETDR